MTKDKALEIAIEWMEGLIQYLPSTKEHKATMSRYNKAIAAIKEALAQPEQLHASEDVSIGVDVTEDGAHVTALRSYRNGAKVVFYSQFHTAPPQLEQEPVAWRTFDGEGGYDYRSYEDNESYADDWNKRNPNHKGWVDKLYTHPQRTWVGLEGEEIRNSWEEATKPDRSTMTMITSFARAIEAKLKDKNCVG